MIMLIQFRCRTRKTTAKASGIQSFPQKKSDQAKYCSKGAVGNDTIRGRDSSQKYSRSDQTSSWPLPLEFHYESHRVIISGRSRSHHCIGYSPVEMFMRQFLGSFPQCNHSRLHTDRLQLCSIDVDLTDQSHSSAIQLNSKTHPLNSSVLLANSS
jgi:hypothetical protein